MEARRVCTFRLTFVSWPSVAGNHTDERSRSGSSGMAAGGGGAVLQIGASFDSGCTSAMLLSTGRKPDELLWWQRIRTEKPTVMARS